MAVMRLLTFYYIIMLLTHTDVPAPPAHVTHQPFEIKLAKGHYLALVVHL